MAKICSGKTQHTNRATFQSFRIIPQDQRMTSLEIDLSNIVTSYHKQSDVQQVSTPLRPVSIVLKSSKPDSNGFWELSEQIFNGISEKSDHVNYSLANHDVAMQQNVLF